MPFAAFASVYALPVLAVAGLAFGGAWAWALPVVIFGLVPLVELFLPGARSNPNAEEEAERRRDARFDALLYLAVPVQFLLLGALVIRAETLPPGELLGGIASVGIVSGALAINVAHELGHRPNRRDQRVAKVLLASSLYHHFFVEHNRGHHARVATPEDPATAVEGEGLYGFWLRSLTGGARSAWQLEADRLARHGRGPWTWDNEVLRGWILEAALVVGVAALAGPLGAAAFVGASAVGILLLETVNYVEHYGLARARLPDGRWERVRPAHSWTSDRPVSRALLFELTRHADHHANPGRPYVALRHVEDAPELPTGYAGMVLLAHVPP
ncbi:MAG: alkane 1-monooxygenase, partial [Myxococcota bacterium]